MTNSESFALEQWLNKYPNNMSYDDIIDRLSDDNVGAEIMVWSLVERYALYEVAEFIEDTKAAHESSLTFGEQQ